MTCVGRADLSLAPCPFPIPFHRGAPIDLGFRSPNILFRPPVSERAPSWAADAVPRKSDVMTSAEGEGDARQIFSALGQRLWGLCSPRGRQFVMLVGEGGKGRGSGRGCRCRRAKGELRVGRKFVSTSKPRGRRGATQSEPPGSAARSAAGSGGASEGGVFVGEGEPRSTAGYLATKIRDGGIYIYWLR
jgi:hypothetical protein